jgi:hypothetical protein
MPRPKHAVAAREPNGRASRAKGVFAKGYPPGYWARIRDNAIRVAREPRLATELGRMLFHDRINTAEHGTGVRYAEQVQSCLRIIGLPCLEPGDPPLMGKGGVLAPGTEAWDRLTDAGQYAAETLASLYDATTIAQRRALVRVCIDGQPVDGHEQFLALKAGLAAADGWFRQRESRQKKR